PRRERAFPPPGGLGSGAVRTEGTPPAPPDAEPGHPAGEPPHPIARMFAIGVDASIIGVAIALAIDWFPVNAAKSTKKIDTLYLPKDRPVKFDVVTRDVLHDFWVPSFRLKTDAVPGITTHIRLTPSRIGRYDVVCAELCGLGHLTMRNYATVVSTPTFNAW